MCAPVRDISKTVGFLDVKEKDQLDENSTNIPVIIPAAGEHSLLKPILGGKPKAALNYTVTIGAQIGTPVDVGRAVSGLEARTGEG